MRKRPAAFWARGCQRAWPVPPASVPLVRGSGALQEHHANKIWRLEAPRAAVYVPQLALSLLPAGAAPKNRPPGDTAVQHPADGLLRRGALLGNAVPDRDRGPWRRRPLLPKSSGPRISGPSSSSGIAESSRNEEACLGLFSQNDHTSGWWRQTTCFPVSNAPPL